MIAWRTATVVASVVLFTFNPIVIAQSEGWRPARKRAERFESRVESHEWSVESRREVPGAQLSAYDAAPRSGSPFSTLRSSLFFVSAQSPEDDRYARGGPSWTYPARRVPATAPVPDYRGESDFGSRSSPFDTRLAQATRRDDEWYGRGTQPPPRRDFASPPSYDYAGASRDDYGSAARRFPGAPRPQADAWNEPQAPSARAGYQEPYHTPPFTGDGPSCPTDPYSRTAPYEANPYAPPGPCAPCQPPPPPAFGDPCDPANFYRCRYTWNAGYVFGVVEGFRFDHDDSRVGGRLGINWGLPLIDDDSGWGIQGGYSGGVAEGGGQQFATAGLFYRGDMRFGAAFNAGAVIDWMQDNAYDTDVWQIRPKASVTLNARNEIGVWGAVNTEDDDKPTGQTIESIEQVNLFYRFLTRGGWDVAPFVGYRDQETEFAVGGNLYVPLTDFWALIGGGFYAAESDSWNAFVGLTLHFGPRARQDFIGQDRHLPYLPVADNTSMTLFLDR